MLYISVNSQFYHIACVNEEADEMRRVVAEKAATALEKLELAAVKMSDEVCAAIFSNLDEGALPKLKHRAAGTTPRR